jgi:hypothetical protein
VRVLTADWFRRQTYPTPACICAYQQLTLTTWALRFKHPRCPQHGQPPHWQVTT